jgi:VCBS repeat-containing protein
MPNSTSRTYAVVDEYAKVQPSGTFNINANGTYSFVIRLEAWRAGNDSNGRLYTITVTAKNAAAQVVTAETTVRVPHNQ